MSRFTLMVIDAWSREAAVEVAIRLDTVEIWSGQRCRAVFDREVLRDWLALPKGVLAVDDVMWTSAGERVEVTIDALVPWRPLEPDVLADLRRRIWWT
jgi:hypothetical protein